MVAEKKSSENVRYLVGTVFRVAHWLLGANDVMLNQSSDSECPKEMKARWNRFLDRSLAAERE